MSGSSLASPSPLEGADPLSIVRAWYHAVSTGGGMTAPDLVADDARWQLMDGFPVGGVWVGKPAIFERYTPELMRIFSDIRAFPAEIIAIGADRVLSTGSYRGTTVAGQSFEVPFAHVWTVVEGKITSLRQYTDTLLFAGARAAPTPDLAK